MEGSLYHHSQNDTTKITSLPNKTSIQDFYTNANSVLLYKVGIWKIGTRYVKPIYIDAKSDVTHYIGIKVQTKILGIPITFGDETTRELKLESNPNNFALESHNDWDWDWNEPNKPGCELDFPKCNFYDTIIRMDFIQRVHTKEYYNLIDLM